MVDIVYDYKHAPTIKRFSQSDKFIRGLMGPFGSGKSTGCVIEIIKRAARQAAGPDGKRKSRWAVIRNTYPQLRDTTIKTFHAWVPPVWFGDWRAADHDYLVNKLAPDLEIEILFRALDRPEHVANLLSLDLTGAWVNEAREIPWTIIQALQGRVGRYPAMKDGGPTWWGVVMDTNPPDDDSWWYELFEVKRPENAEIFRQPAGDSETAENITNLPKGYYKNLLTNLGANEIKVYVKGDYGYVQDGKPVFPEYVDNVHCSEAEPIKNVPIQRGWDFGLTPACEFSQLMPNGRWITFDEMCADSLGIDRFSDQVLTHCVNKYSGYKFEDVGDPSGNAKAQTDERTCFEIMRGKGIEIEGGEETITMRLEAVKWALRQLVDGKPMVAVHPRCVKLRKGYQGRYKYKRMQMKEERYADVPDKNEYSHPHDANQYVAAKLFGARIKAAGVQPEDKPEPRERYKVVGRRRSFMAA
ncbi:MAG TPA: hypothetical protein VFU31_24960 [Candidatus Binatia bacterium]|nr:hypothetical protein [Candidatus Binatia bacterium]